MAYYIRKKVSEVGVNEDGSNTSQASDQNTQQNSAKQQAASNAISSYKQKILQLQSQIQQAERDYNSKKQSLQQQILQLNKAMVDAGGTPEINAVSESFEIRKKYRISKRIFESVQGNKQEELTALIEITFENLDSVSYNPDKKGCARLARKIIEYLNTQNWNDGADHWDDVAECVKRYFSKGIASFSRRELNELTDKLKETIKSSEYNGFDWIFGKQA